MQWEDVNWTDLVQDRDNEQAIMKRAMNLLLS
jgi:hypothetical protein